MNNLEEKIDVKIVFLDFIRRHENYRIYYIMGKQSVGRNLLQLIMAELLLARLLHKEKKLLRISIFGTYKLSPYTRENICLGGMGYP